MTTLILGKAFGGLEYVAFGGFGTGDGAVLGCFGAFSVGTGEDVRGRFEDYLARAATRSGALAGS